MDPDIQKNTNILLEGYPFLKVFSKQTDINIFERDNFEIIDSLSGMHFIINYDAYGKAISASPYFVQLLTKQEIVSSLRDQAIELMTFYQSNKELIESYIKYQLINSGFLDFLSDVPVEIQQHKSFKSVEVNGKLLIEPSPEFPTRIILTLSVHKNSIVDDPFHNDNYLFHILQYDKSRGKSVLGSEMLFYHEDNDTHRMLKRTEFGHTYFPIGDVGNLISEKHQMVKRIYKKIRDEHRHPPPLLRFKLNSGDTMVFPDTLWKHSVINPTENRVENQINIEVKTKSRGLDNVTVTVCSERKRTLQSDYNGRRLIALFCQKMDRFLYDEYILPPFSLIDDGIKLDAPEVNLTEDECTEFLSQLSTGNSCVTIGTTPTVEIKHRGGLKYKKRRKTNNGRKTNKKHKKRIKRKTV